MLLETGAICECEEHGWMRDRADPHARERALVIARQDPPPGVSTEEAIAELRDVLYSIGDTRYSTVSRTVREKAPRLSARLVRPVGC